MDKIDISVIIPAYNASEYIDRAVQSIKKQTAFSYEIIIVENGSTDDTFSKCMKYADESLCVKVYKSEKGVSKARNLGIKKAAGEWICFLDADDYLYADAFKTLAQIKDNSDIILFGHNSDEEMVSGEERSYKESEEYLNLRCKMLKNPTQTMTVWGKLFKRNIIVDNNIYFEESLELSEDSDFVFRYMQCSKKAVELTDQLYHYSKDNASTVRTYKPGMADKYISALKHTLTYADSDNEQIKKAYYQYIMAHLLLILVHDTYCKENPASAKERRRNLKALISNDIFSQAIKGIKISDCRNIRMMPALCFKLKMNFAAVIMVKMRVNQNEKKRK